MFTHMNQQVFTLKDIANLCPKRRRIWVLYAMKGWIGQVTWKLMVCVCVSNDCNGKHNNTNTKSALIKLLHNDTGLYKE